MPSRIQGPELLRKPLLSFLLLRGLFRAKSLVVFLAGDGYYLAVGGAVAQHNWSHIMRVLQDMKFQCKLLDCSEELGMISIQGPLR